MAGSGSARVRRRVLRRPIIIAVAMALVVIPAPFVFGSHSFSDVPTSAFYHGSVSALMNAGITSGCGGSRFCPGSAVTRGQMAVFLDRLGGLGGSAASAENPVVNALTTNGFFVQGGRETFTLAGGNRTECETTQASESGVNPFGSYSITYQLFDVDPDVDTSLINIQVRDSDAPADVNDDEFDVCFSMVDNTPLTAGTYKTYFNFLVFLGEGLFGGAATTAGSGQRASPETVRR